MAPPSQIALPAFEQARRVVEEHACALSARGREQLELLASAGRVLAEEVVAERDYPPFPRATRDGYAVRASDVARPPARLKVIGEIKAGIAPGTGPQTVGAQETAEIMTGAPVPAGADAVVMVEHTRAAADTVVVERPIAQGENIVPTGAEAHKGDVLLSSGVRMSYASIAVAASVGKTHVEVFVRPRVAIISTGDEVVEISAQPGPHQIRNSNSYSLAAQVTEAGGEPLILPIARDEPDHLRRLVREGLAADLLVLTGGVSAGKYDLVEQVLSEFEAEFFFTGALIQPGRPVVFGRGGREKQTYFVGLPGNPVSTMVTFELFARPMLDALSGAKPKPLVFVQVKLKVDVATKTGLTRFLPAVLSGEFERSEVELVRWQGSGDIAAMARANCYIVVPPDRGRIAAGEFVSIMLKQTAN
jgi:molybdopterin molybdotransferase